MTEAARLSLSIPASTISTAKTDRKVDRNTDRRHSYLSRFVPFRPDQLAGRQSDLNGVIPMALFSGIGAVVFLVAVLSGVQGAWY